MEFYYDKIHKEVKVPCQKRRARRLAKEDVLREYTVPIGQALLDHDEERFAFYILEAAQWIEEWEKERE